MWWIAWTESSVRDDAFAAVGIQGQNIYVNPANNVVIVTFGAQTKPGEKEPVDPMVFFDAVVAALKPVSCAEDEACGRALARETVLQLKEFQD